MKIIHIVEPLASGINTFILELVNGMPNDEHLIIHGSRLDNNDFNKIKSKYNGNVSFQKWKYVKREISFLSDILSLLFLIRLLKKESFDVIHLHSSKGGVLGRIAILFHKKKAIVYTPNGVSFLREDVSNLKKKIFKSIEYFCSKMSGIVVSSSIGEKKTLEKAGIKSILIQNGVEKKVNLSIEKKSTQKFIICNCGRITFQKNPRLFNEIAQSFLNYKVPIEFIWIGDGEDKKLLTSENITVTGWIDRDLVERQMQVASMYLSTSKWEGLSLATLEALSMGLPMVLSNCVGNSDLIENNGVLFNSKDEAVNYIKLITETPQIITKLTSQSEEIYTQKFQSKFTVKKYQKLYRYVANTDKK